MDSSRSSDNAAVKTGAFGRAPAPLTPAKKDDLYSAPENRRSRLNARAAKRNPRLSMNLYVMVFLSLFYCLPDGVQFKISPAGLFPSRFFPFFRPHRLQYPLDGAFFDAGDIKARLL